MQSPARETAVAGLPELRPLPLAGMRSFYFAAFAALGFYAPYFPLWLEAHGFHGLSMSAIVGLSPALSLVAPPLVGMLSDAHGARGHLLGRVCAASALALALLCVAEALGVADRFGIVFGCVFVYALCRSPIILLADRIAIESGGNYGRRRLWGSAGFLIAAGAFGRLCLPAAWRWLPGVVACALGVAWFASLRLPRAAQTSMSASGDTRALLREPRFVALLACAATFSASHASYDLCGSLAFRDLGAGGDLIGLLWASGVLAEIGLLAVAARCFEVLRPERLLLLAYLVGALRWLGMAALPRAELAFLLQPLHAVSFGLVWVSSLEVVRRRAEPNVLGKAQGLLMAAGATGSTLGTWAFGPLYAARGAPAVFLMATLLALTAAALARRLSPR